MDIVKNSIISIKHYSKINPVISLLLDFNENEVKIKLLKEFSQMTFLEGDPVVIAFEQITNNIAILGGTISKISPGINQILIDIDKQDFEQNKRSYERYPTSLYADIILENFSQKNTVIIKDISWYGMQIHCKLEIQTNSNVDIDIYTEERVVRVKGEIVRKTKHKKHFEYGIRIIYDNSFSMVYMKEYLEMLKKEQENFVLKISNHK